MWPIVPTNESTRILRPHNTMSSPYKHSPQSERVGDGELTAQNELQRSQNLFAQDTYKERVFHRRNPVRKSEGEIQAIMNSTKYRGKIGIMPKTTFERDPEWLMNNRKSVNSPAERARFEADGWTVRDHGKLTYAYSRDYVRLNKLLRREMFERMPVTELYENRLVKLIDAKPAFMMGCATSVMFDENEQLVQVFKPITGPHNMYPAWLMRYIGTGADKRDVVFHDIGIVKLRGGGRARRMAIYKEGDHFEVFVPALNKDLERTSSKRDPVRISDEDARMAVARYRRMADSARARLNGRKSELPHFVSTEDGGYPQIGYITLWDEDTGAPTVKPLYGFVKDGELVMYINVSQFEEVIDKKTRKPTLKRTLKRMVIDPNYEGGEYRGHRSTIALLQNEVFVQVDSVDGLSSFENSFATTWKRSHEDDKHSPGRIIDHKAVLYSDDGKPIIDMDELRKSKRLENIVKTLYERDPLPRTHEGILAVLRMIKEHNARAIRSWKEAANAARTGVLSSGEAAEIVAPVPKAPKRKAVAARKAKPAKSDDGDDSEYERADKPNPGFLRAMGRALNRMMMVDGDVMVDGDDEE